MLRWALIALLLCLSYARSTCTEKFYCDTIRTVTVVVTLTPKATVKNIKPAKAISPQRKVLAAATTPAASSKTKLKHNNVDKPYHVNEKIVQNKNRKSGSKNEKKVEDSYKKLSFFTGLILLVAGIVITLFFRSGFFLISGIVLIVSGYYLLLYLLLFT